MRAAVAVLLALTCSVQAQPAQLAVSALWAGDGVRVNWPVVRGAVTVCVLRPGGQQALGCTREPGRWRQSRSSLDAGLVIRPGERVEVRAYDARGELVAQGQTLVRWAVYLPAASR